MIILGADPGSKNFALAVIELKNNKLSVLGTKMVENTLHKFDMTMQDQYNAFVKEVRMVRDEFKPDYCIMERFQTRGNGGNTIEFVSMMNALLFYTMRKNSPMLVTASTWKNACTRANILLKDIYAEYKMTTQQFAKEIHEFDAAMMAVYRLYHERDTSYYSNFNVHTFIQRFLDAPKL